ncbi:hypothetical protein HYPSUDRAFT_430911 [Hypholoma sublateritium FD-334 SS-4]|uniref:Ubiquitin 3 binding protein But2 C-terminal domain-containing protein n=1 Tax=Hypholoma sublateritium (strain FD-334 SS-4) TaxID=945553 RepID=A0A0D2N5V4_HYPSF|nr:hypothetical protein HYPSUDRAFT_430911 [Hypholoma sublateritium FD-334 SS-4]
MPAASHFPYAIHLLIISLILRGAYSYTWSFEETPSQCGQLTVAIAGNDGTPPFRLLVVPFGPSLLPNGVEPRSVLDIPFSDNQSFASGGTSATIMVANSSDSSCFNATAPAPLDFSFQISPTPTEVVQCEDLRISWNATTIQSTPNFLGIIPGGQSFVVPEGTITTDATTGTGFSYQANLRAGTTFLLMGGDVRGNGTGGSVTYIVALGNDDESCLSNNSPSSTPGSPAGGGASSTIGPSSTAAGGSVPTGA